jgi:uncharacterized RDD family membrane protein YckC
MVPAPSTFGVGSLTEQREPAPLGQATPVEPRPASIGRRLAAAIIDVPITLVVPFVTYVVVALSALGLEATDAEMDAYVGETLGRYALGTLLFVLGYFGAGWSRLARGQTLGMRISGIRVVRTDGGLLDVFEVGSRLIGAIVAAVPVFLGFIWIAFDARRRGWHDRIAGSVVVHDPA